MAKGNENYKRGRRREYYVMEKLRREGNWEIIQRSKGSHSPIDIIAINKRDKIIRFIQVKAGLLLNSESVKIYEENDWLNGNFEVEFDIEN